MADRGNRERWQEIVKQTHKCPFCPKHGRDNRGRRQKPDGGKNHRRK